MVKLKAIPSIGVSYAAEYRLYCDQPIISETMKCESDDFIQTMNEQDKMLCTFMFEGQKGGKGYLTERMKIGSVRERELRRERDSVGADIRTFSQTTSGNVI